MATLNYANPIDAGAGRLRNVVIFMPVAVAIAVYIACCVWFQGSDLAGICLLATILVAGITTIVLLYRWRRTITLLALIGGWVVVAVVAAFIAFVALVNLGVLQE